MNISKNRCPGSLKCTEMLAGKGFRRFVRTRNLSLLRIVRRAPGALRNASGQRVWTTLHGKRNFPQSPTLGTGLQILPAPRNACRQRDLYHFLNMDCVHPIGAIRRRQETLLGKGVLTTLGENQNVYMIPYIRNRRADFASAKKCLQAKGFIQLF